MARMNDLRSSRRITLIQSPLRDSESKTPPAVTEQAELETHDETLFENPQFRHYEETSNIQLFFDLFFIANLATFTNDTEVNTNLSLSSYVGIFCVLWFTWCQVTLYDVRFSTDSIFERVAHACHFGVMVGLGVVAPPFQDPEQTSWATLQQFSLILMTSRLVLFCQYGTTLVFTWKYRTARKPLMLVMVTLLVAAILHLALSISFLTQVAVNAYLGWYVASVSEVAANIAIAGHWPVVSFAGTHLVERMSCLTLIILGEGVIGLCKSIVKIEFLVLDFSPGTIGAIISSTTITYVVYQLYFDNICVLPSSNVKQQLFSFLHFPFHLALVLLMEGINQFVIWRHIVEKVQKTFRPISMVYSNSGTQAQIFQIWNVTIDEAYTIFPATQNVYDIVSSNLKLLNPTSNSTNDQKSSASINMTKELLSAIFDGYGFEPPHWVSESTETIQAISDQYLGVFSLVFGYSCIAAGVVLIVLAILSFISLPSNQQREKSAPNLRHCYIGIVVNVTFGIALSLLSTMTTTENIVTLGNSAWTLPMLLLVLFIALVLNHLPRSGWRGLEGKGGEGGDERKFSNQTLMS